ncbi:conjugal transfer relaxase TraA, partial [Sphingomonas koreensis]|nr:conjugal transfer relaxase TraA [Sphingomonas koreensis]
GDLGDDVTVKVERGERQFAAGDRIMFLRNERGMGVKNGTLATIERVSPEGMAVRLDDGRGVAFDTKDYAAVDHGYAATFHKAQGVTVDRAHVLATPGMDRHSAYVGMSRHRDDVQLHYGRDDFADQRQLVRALSRDRGKDMAGDYARPEQDQARAFADRREIRFPELARQVAEKVRDKARGMFAGFRPKPATEKTTLPERGAASLSRAQSREPLAPSQARAIERYGRAAADMDRMRAQGLPVLAHQESALRRAGEALDAIRPHAARDLASAIERDPRLARDAAEGNTGGAAKAMEVERQVRIDPEKRAGRFVEQWQDMKAARASMERAGDRAGAERLGKRMESMASGLHRDPQLESALKRHAPELALNMERGRSIGQELAQSVGQGRDRDRGMSR